MSITDELRKYAGRLSDEAARKSEHGFSPVAMALEGIADRIDAEHEAKVSLSYWQGACYRDGYDDGFASADDWLAQHEDAMAEHGWVKLPVYADGVPIRVGDVMEWIDLEGKVSVTCTVEAVGVNAFIAWDKANGRYAQKCATAYRHHHEPTVEDVLTEFAKRVCNSGHQWGLDADDTIAEFASRLCLAKEGE